MLELPEALAQLGNQVSEETTGCLEPQAQLDFEVILDSQDQMDSLDLPVLLALLVQEETQVVLVLLVQRDLLELLDLLEHLEETVPKEQPEPLGRVDNRATLDCRDPVVRRAQPGHRAPLEVPDLRDHKVMRVQLVQPAPRGRRVDRDLEEI